MATGKTENYDEAPRFILKRWTTTYGASTSTFKTTGLTAGDYLHFRASGIGYAYPTYTKKDGTVVMYYPVGIVHAQTGAINCSFSYITTTAYNETTGADSGWFVGINNNSGSNITTNKTIKLEILFVRSDLTK